MKNTFLARKGYMSWLKQASYHVKLAQIPSYCRRSAHKEGQYSWPVLAGSLGKKHCIRIPADIIAEDNGTQQETSRGVRRENAFKEEGAAAPDRGSRAALRRLPLQALSCSNLPNPYSNFCSKTDEAQRVKAQAGAGRSQLLNDCNNLEAPETWGWM